MLMVWSVVKETWSKALREASEVGDLSLIPYEVPLDYTHWSYSKSGLWRAVPDIY